jgi:hypothetical protein
MASTQEAQMPETDILNPTAGWDPDLGDSMNPNFGFTRKRPSARSTKKAAGGVPYTRELQNSGHQFTFSWLGRTWACVQRLKRYYEQYEDGFFTIVDHDGGGRHYVGRFTTEVDPIETANGKWDVQNVTFEEIPRVPMVNYPNDWDHDAVTLYVKNDFTDQKLATEGTWALTPRTIAGKPRITADNAGTVGEWAQFEYRGYGFRLWMLKGTAYGSVDVYLDDVFQAAADMHSGTDDGPQIALAITNVPLDIHRVKIVMTGDAASWAWLEVMR